MAATFVNCFREELICFICQEIFEDPVRLSCHHNFCRQCILKTWSANVDMVHCPECKTQYYTKPRLTKNLKLANIVASFKAVDALIPSAVEDPKSLPSHDEALCGTEVPRDHMKQELQKRQKNKGEQMQAMAENLSTVAADEQQAEESFQTTREMMKAHYKKMRELLVQDMESTLQKMDRDHSRFCLDNSALLSQLNERHQEAEQLLSSVQAALNKAEDLNFMKDTAEVQILLNRSEAYTTQNPPRPNKGGFKIRKILKKMSEKEKSLQEYYTLSQSRLGPTKAIKRRRVHSSTRDNDNDCDPSCFGSLTKRRCTTKGSVGPSYASGSLSAPGPSSSLGRAPQ